MAILSAFPKVAIKIGGHTDGKGAVDFNLKLSRERADNVMADLARKIGRRRCGLAVCGIAPRGIVAAHAAGVICRRCNLGAAQRKPGTL